MNRCSQSPNSSVRALQADELRPTFFGPLHRFWRQRGSDVVCGTGETRHELFQFEGVLTLLEVRARNTSLVVNTETHAQVQSSTLA